MKTLLDINNKSLNPKIQKFLVGKNTNLIGTVLAFKRGKNLTNTLGFSAIFSYILYFDHRTARVERYLINANTKDVNHVNKYIDLKQSTNIFHALQFKLLEELNDGKLDRNFYSIFMLELLRSYVGYAPQYRCSVNDGDMRNLVDRTDNQFIPRSYTDSNYPNFPGVELTLKPDYINETLNVNTHPIINVPKGLHNVSMAKGYDIFNIKLVPTIPKDGPECIQFLKSQTHSKLITSSLEVSSLIEQFNISIAKKLKQLENS